MHLFNFGSSFGHILQLVTIVYIYTSFLSVQYKQTTFFLLIMHYSVVCIIMYVTVAYESYPRC